MSTDFTSSSRSGSTEPERPPPPFPPGWYPDPENANAIRYWDGASWSPATAPTGPLAARAPDGTAVGSPVGAPVGAPTGAAHDLPVEPERDPSLPLTDRGPRTVGLAGALRLLLQGTTDYRGRSSRSEFWWPAGLVVLLIMVVFAALAVVIDPMDDAQLEVVDTVLILLRLALFAVGLFFLPLTVRRLHDVDTSGWWVLLAFVPVFGFALVIFLIRVSDAGPNTYGPGREPSGG